MRRPMTCPNRHSWLAAPAGAAETGTPTPELCPVCGSAGAEIPRPDVPGYELREAIDAGPLGVVYAARQRLHDRPVELLVLADDAFGGSQDLTRFAAGARAASALRHPGIPEVYEAGDAAGAPYLATEPSPGETLRERLHRHGSLGGREAARLVAALARALQWAHERGVTHGHLNPAHISLTPGGPRAGGFGLAVFFEGKAFPDDPAFVAPEQVPGAGGTVGPAADVYALGATLYAALTGCAPFPSFPMEETFRLVRRGNPLPPSQLRPGIAKELEDVCLKALARRPGGRFGSASALADELERVADGKPAGGGAARLVTRGGRWARRNPAAVGAMAMAVLLGLLALGVARRQGPGEGEYRAAREEALATAAERDAARRERDGEATARKLAEQRQKASEQYQRQVATERDEARKKAVEAEAAGREAERKREQEAAARAAAEDNARGTDEVRRQALGMRGEAFGRLARIQAAAGVRRLDDGDSAGALPWFAEALRLAQREGLPEAGHRLRFASALARCPRPVREWAHETSVAHARFSPDGKRILTAGADGAPQVWDAASGKPIGERLIHGVAVVDACFSPDGKRVASVAADQTLHVYDAETAKEAFAPVMLLTPPLAVAFSPDGRRVLVVSAKTPTDAAEADLRLCDAATGEPAGEPFGTQVAPRPAAFSPDGRRVLTACLDNCARVWDAAGGGQVGAALSHAAAVTHAAFSHDGSRVLTASTDGTTRIWETETGKPLLSPLRHGGPVTAAAFGPDSRRVATASDDRLLRVWDAATGELTAALKQPDGVTMLTFSPDGRHVLAVGADGSVHVWDPTAGEEAVSPLRHGGPVRSAAFNPQGNAVLTLEANRLTRLWDLTAGESPAPYASITLADDPAAFSPDGRLLVRLSGTSARVQEALGGKEVGVALTHRFPVVSAAFSPDGRRLLTVSRQPDGDEAAVRVWDAATGKPAGESMEHLRPVRGASFSPDGRRVATVSADDKVRVWDAVTATMLGKSLDHSGPVDRALFTPDGTRVITVDAAGAVRAWDAAAGERVGAPMGHGSPVLHLAFAPGGKRLVTASADGTARVWDAESGTAVGEPLPHGAPVRCAAFSRDGARVVTGSDDRTARVWNAATGKPLTPPLPHSDAVTVAVFDHEGTRVATASGDRVRAWDAASGEPLTPRLRHGRAREAVTSLAFVDDGRLLSAAGPPGDPRSRREWLLKADGRPVSDIVRLAGVLSGYRLDESGNAAPLPPADAAKEWAELRKSYPADFDAASARLMAWERRGAEECEAERCWAGAVRHLDALPAAGPNPELYARRARAHAALGEWAPAEADYSRALERGEGGWEWWSGRGDARSALGRWDGAASDYSEALKRNADRAVLWSARGRAEAEAGRWDKAAADFTKAERLGERGVDAEARTALAKLAAGDEPGYRRACTRLLERFGTTDDAAAFRMLAHVCTLAPGAVPDVAPLLRRASGVAGEGVPPLSDPGTLAALLYRAGRFEPARQKAEEAARASGPSSSPRDRLFQALACLRLGKAEEARGLVAGASRWLAGVERPAGPAAHPWDERLACRLLLKEAEERLKRPG